MRKIILLISLLMIAAGCSVAPIARVPQQRACTQEAMLCADGSAVGRTGPNCEFVCPGIKPKEPQK